MMSHIDSTSCPLGTLCTSTQYCMSGSAVVTSREKGASHVRVTEVEVTMSSLSPVTEPSGPESAQSIKHVKLSNKDTLY